MNKIYFIQSGENGPVKIGQSEDPIARLEQLQTGNPEELKLLWVYEGDEYTEHEIHEMFKKDRVRGEWFKFTDELKTFVLKELKNYNEIALLNDESISITRSFSGDIFIDTGDYDISLSSTSAIITRFAGSTVHINNFYPWGFYKTEKKLLITIK